MNPFIQSDIKDNLRYLFNADGDKLTNCDVSYLLSWLASTPTMSSYRVNTLKSNCAEITVLIKHVLSKRKEELSLPVLPTVLSPHNDVVLVGPWDGYKFTTEKRKEVIVDSYCGAAVLRGANIFAPGVMGMPGDVSIGEIVNIYADVAKQCRKGLKTLLDSDDKKLIAEGIIKMTRHQLFKESQKPSGVAIEVTMPTSMVPVIGQEIEHGGLCLLQNLPSIICSRVLDPQAGEIILDMCAAPGNKTTHIAELMRNKGLVIALDKVKSKIPTLEEKCKSHDISIVKAFCFDSTKIVKEDTENKITIDPHEGPPFSEETFDRILLDAPCSALGQRPLLRNSITLKEMRSYVHLQKKLFDKAVKLLKPGGRLVYSTCTINQEENELLVAWALNTFTNIKLKPAHPLLGGPGWPNSRLSDEERLMVQRFGPEEDALRIPDPVYKDTIGFFIACFDKSL